MLYMFRTILVHHQEQLYKPYIAFGICLYHTSGCCVAIARRIGMFYIHIGSYTYCRMMHGAYNVKKVYDISVKGVSYKSQDGA